MKFKNLPDEYLGVLRILESREELSLPDIDMEFEFSDKMEIGFNGEQGYIKCNAKNRFARLISVFARYYKKFGGKPFSKTERAEFETVSFMMDVSFGSALSVKSIKEMCEYISMMGYNQILLCIEDMYEIPGKPYFGYLRGRYNHSELQEIDDYAFSLGIEIVPCIQTLGHLQRYFVWPEAAKIKENDSVLLPDCEATYEFIEQMLLAASSPFRSKRIHIGCDETHGLGTGNYLKTHPLTPPLKIFVEHINRVSELCKKHGLRPMMWGDMFIAFSSKRYSNYDKDAVITDEIKALVNPDIEIVFWHYGQYENCEDYLIDKYVELSGIPIFAGGIRIWASPLPDNIFTKKHIESSLRWCKKKGVKEVCLTVWAYNTTIYHTGLLELCRWGELSYNETSDELYEHFEFITGADASAFVKMSNFNDVYRTKEDEETASYNRDAIGGRRFVSDIVLNVLEDRFIGIDLPGYYAETADFFRPYAAAEGKWQYLYKFSLALFELMAAKSYIVENLRSAYLGKKADTLKLIVEKYLPEYISKLDEVACAHNYHKDKYLRPFGGEIVDERYGGMKERGKTALRRLNAYLSGELESLPELEAERLPFNGSVIKVKV